MHEVKVTIQKSGVAEIQVNGLKGKSCKQVTDELEKALGKKTEDRLTPEYHQHENRLQARQ
jgi:hypothetical protein